MTRQEKKSLIFFKVICFLFLLCIILPKKKKRLAVGRAKSSILPIFQDSQLRQSSAYSLHQPQGNKEHGTERSGSLYKKSDGWVHAATLAGYTAGGRGLPGV